MRIPKPKLVGPNTYRIRVFYQDPNTKKRRSLTVRTVGTLADARRVANGLATLREAGLLGQIDHEEYLARALDQKGSFSLVKVTGPQEQDTTPTLEAHLRSWLDSRRVKRLAAKTRRDYAWLAEKHIIPRLGQRRLAEITADLVEEFVEELAALDLAPRTQKYVLDVLRMGLEDQVGKVWSKNPGREVASPDLNAAERVARSMSENEARAYADALGEHPLDYALRLCLFTGARPGEVLALQASDIEITPKGAYVTIRRALNPVSEPGQELKAPKTKTQRRVAMHATLGRQLRDLARGKPQHHPLFTQPSGNHYSVSALREHHAASLRAAEISRPYRLYDLRHTHASLLLRAGVNPFVVSKRLGHSTMAFTMDTYGHELTDMQEDAVERLEDLLD